jgi:hypothetical protein
MSWHFSQALEEAYSAENSSDGAPFAPLRGTPTHGTFWSPGKTTDALSRSRSGMTYRPSTDTHGEAVLTWCLAASLVRTSPQPEKVQASPEPGAACGRKWHASLARFDPDSCSWRTHQYSLAGDLEPFSETWPRWGMMRDGECWELSMPAHRTSESESGLWPTIRAADGERGGRGDLIQAIRGNQNSHFKSWPTPTVCGNYNRKGASKNSGDGLATAVKMWPTPHANCGNGIGAGPAKQGGENLQSAIGGSLNPTWVEWLMGWPLFWTSLDMSVNPYYELWHEAQQRTQASPENIQSRIMRNVWWDIDPSAAPQGRQSNQQREIKCNGGMSAVPCENTLLDRELGEGQRQTVGMQDLRSNLQAEADQKIQIVWQAGMPEGKRETIGRVAMEVKFRLNRLRCIGNGQVPAVAALAWRKLNSMMP